MNNPMEKTLSQMWDLMDLSQQPTLSQTASIWVKISYLTIRKADFWFGGLLKHLNLHKEKGVAHCNLKGDSNYWQLF